MCCTVSPKAINPLQATSCIGLNPVDCGCGCIGQNQTVLRLERYQEHLKAELKSVERQMNAMKKHEK